MPVSCCSCKQRNAAIKRPKTGEALCRECFFEAFEKEVHQTIVTNQLFTRGDTVAVAASGGKDSTVLAYVMKCIHFCEEVQHNPQQFYRRTGIKPTFDAIYTSNLIDKLTPPVLVTAAAPLLKKNGSLLTTPFLYRCCAASAEEYLQDTFGFSPEYLPLIAGVRCIGHDGRYFSGTSALPTPVYGIESVLADFQCSRYDKCGGDGDSVWVVIVW